MGLSKEKKKALYRYFAQPIHNSENNRIIFKINKFSDNYFSLEFYPSFIALHYEIPQSFEPTILTIPLGNFDFSGNFTKLYSNKIYSEINEVFEKHINNITEILKPNSIKFITED